MRPPPVADTRTTQPAEAPRPLRRLGRAARVARLVWLAVGLVIVAGAALEGLYRLEGSLRRIVSSWRAAAPAPDPSAPVRAEAILAAEHMAWRPYVYYRRNPFKGRYITVDSDGLRHTVAPPPSGRSAATGAAATVFVFGGSVVWGTNLADSSTIPSVLARDLAAAGIANVAVRNYGEAGYAISQEIIQLMLDLRAGRRPTVVVFCDGYNDVAAGMNGFVGATKDEAGRARDFDVGRILYAPDDDLATDARAAAEVSRLALGRSQLLARLAPPVHAPTLSDSAVVERVSATYVASMAVVEALARRYGFVPVFAWWPLIDPSVKPLSPAERRIVAERSPAEQRFEANFQRVRRRLASLAPAAGQQTPLDVGTILAHDTTTDFVDDLGHTTEAASARIAGWLATRVAPILQRAGHGR